MARRFRDILKCDLMALWLLLVGTFLMPFWFGEGHGTSLSRLAMVSNGMTREEVVHLLGKPGAVNHNGNGSESWFYTRATFCQGKISLDSNGKVTETDHDH
jgi:outer membrane protein assembly factor BamE (lipoprotein component of BamABCDE complex)